MVENQEILIQKLERLLLNHEHRDNGKSEAFKEECEIQKRPFLKRRQGLIARFKIDPDSLKLENLPKYKYAKKIEKTYKSNDNANDNVQVKKLKNVKVTKNKKSEINNSQKMQIKTDLVCTKNKNTNKNSVKEINSKASITDFNNLSKTAIVESSHYEEQFGSNDLVVQKKPMLWAQILDSNNVEPIDILRLRDVSSSSNIQQINDDTENLSLFELLEKKAEEGSFSFDAISLKHWMQKRIKLLEEENESINLIDETTSETLKKTKIHPLPCDLDEKTLLQDSDDNDEKSIDSENECGNHSAIKSHVRFLEKVEITQIESDGNENDGDVDQFNSDQMTSTPLGVSEEQFEIFKKQLFCSSNAQSESNSTLNNDANEHDEIKKDLFEKSEVLKVKLQELEKEIATFQKYNSELIKMKQEHELEKIKLQQEKIELEEKLNDERIKLEIYLHDERVKIEEEREKLKKDIKLNRLPNRKEKEEITKFKEQIETLQKELKSKENKHVSAQARLRAQIRNLEKDFKELSFELDHLKKENKKLESENAGLIRQGNNKMLQEINKTIAKLAVPQAKNIVASEVKNKNPKCVVAKVVHHKNDKKLSQYRTKSKSIPDLCQDNDSETNSGISSEKESDMDTESDMSNKSRKVRSQLETVRNKKEPYPKISKEKDYVDPSIESNIDHEAPTENFKREITNSDGSKDIWYMNGNLKKISADGMIIRMLYYNKDIKETNINEGTVKYYYAETNTWHTTYLDGLEIIEFPNGQTEHRYKDGSIEIHFPNGSIRILKPTDDIKAEEWRYPDGTSLTYLKNGDKILLMPNGQKEIHTRAHKRREYPDGTVKLVYPDGSQETRYSNGRIRLKDKDGNLIMDSETLENS